MAPTGVQQRYTLHFSIHVPAWVPGPTCWLRSHQTETACTGILLRVTHCTYLYIAPNVLESCHSCIMPPDLMGLS